MFISHFKIVITFVFFRNFTCCFLSYMYVCYISRGVKLNNFEICLLSVVFAISKVHEFIIQPSYVYQTRNMPLRSTVRNLWREEGVGWFAKGVSARLVHSSVMSCVLMLGYESVKRFSLKSEYQDQVRWWGGLLKIVVRMWWVSF